MKKLLCSFVFLAVAAPATHAGYASYTLGNGGLYGTQTGVISASDGHGNSINPTNVYIDQFHVTYTSDSDHPASTTSNLNTFCIDLFHDIVVPQTVKVYEKNDLGATFVHANEMSYIYNQHGNVSLQSNSAEAAALQLALWDLTVNPSTRGGDTKFTWDGANNRRANAKGAEGRKEGS